ncbi:MAG: PcfJ domain-containing protein, partial [Candidatus Poseidoniales archaeon]
MDLSEDKIAWVNTHLGKHEKEITTDEAEHIIDFLASDAAPRVARLSYKDAKIKADAWSKKLQDEAAQIHEAPEDTEVVLDFGDGFKIVKLIGENAFKREGNLMRHCVASYYGKDTEVYSLRDKNNNPHCTIEKDKQIKGKGNGDIHPKYIDYVVRFLEHTGMKVRASEMEHLGYKDMQFCVKKLKNKLYKERYLHNSEEPSFLDGVVVCEFPDLRDNGVVLGSLRLRDTSITSLPDNLSVGGYLDL